jgi:hypothetical protein
MIGGDLTLDEQNDVEYCRKQAQDFLVYEREQAPMPI